ncbi:MAG: hypothetical protein JWR38_1224 [Mucilaginibacter sp.]|nr:hypothetical protein [Mucilaginibacter sp.]
MKNSKCTILLAFLFCLIVFASCNKGAAKLNQTKATPKVTNSVDSITPIFLKRADTLLTSITTLYLNGMPRDIWSTNYPRTDGYWDGAAVIWGHGAAFSGYVAAKEAAACFPDYKSKYETNYDTRLLTAIDKFRNTRNGGPEAYAVYPGTGDERYYDDNIWVGLDMTDLYMLTHESKYLDRAKLVWNFVLSGTDNLMGGGVYWKEGNKSKNTCSTAPAAVLAAKLYQATHEDAYLQSAKSLYAWCKQTLQDPADYLYWDNVHLSDESNPNSAIIIAKDKYPYNSGQPMQAAALLYKITHEAQYLTDAQNIAGAAYNKWFIAFNSAVLGETFQILAPGHVWFQAIMFRGFIELYKIDHNKTYVTAYKKTLTHAWLSNCRNPGTNLLNSDFRGGTTQTSWEILHEGACVEMLARLAALEKDGL